MRGYSDYYPPIEQTVPTPYPQLANVQSEAINFDKPQPLIIHRDNDGVQAANVNKQRPLIKHRDKDGVQAANVDKQQPLIIHRDHNGVQWMTFWYPKVLPRKYTIRCDVEEVYDSMIPKVFKANNSCYPLANDAEYRSGRKDWEIESNGAGWKLAKLNSCLRGKRGAIIQAVTHWRNNHKDVRLHSARVKRMKTRARMLKLSSYKRK